MASAAAVRMLEGLFGEIDKHLREVLATIRFPMIAAQQEGDVVTNEHRILNFQGPGVSVTDDPAAFRTNITIPGGQFTGVATVTSFASSATSKAISLWNGTSNDAPPSNWETVAFNDSAWSAPHDLGPSSDVTSAEILWPTAVPADATEEALFRQHFTMPSGTPQAATLVLMCNDACDGAYINGTLIGGSVAVFGSPIRPINLSVPASLLVTGDNVIALKGRDIFAQTPPISGDAQVIWRLDVTYQTLALGQAYTNVQDQKTGGTAGGTFTSGSFQTRALNTLQTDGIGVTLSSNQVTLPAGTYRVYASAPAYRVQNHQLRIQNITAGATLVLGSSEYNENGVFATNRSVASGRFTLSASSAIEVQHRGNVTRSTDGFGLATGFGTEVYAILEIFKEA